MKLDTMYELCDTISDELEEANKKIRNAGGKLTSGDVEYIDKLTHTLKSIKTSIAMAEAEDKGYSGYYWDGRYYHDGENRMDGSSNARGRGSNANRDSMGRYTRDDAREDFMRDVKELMRKAPSETAKKKLERIVEEMK